VLYRQDNRVRETLKMPYEQEAEIGVGTDHRQPDDRRKARLESLNRLEESLARRFSGIDPSFGEYVTFVRRNTALDIYPLLNIGEYFVKDFAIRLVIEKFRPAPDSRFIYLGDSRNDLCAMRFLVDTFGQNARIIAPANATAEIKDYISSLAPGIGAVLEEDVSSFGLGLWNYLEQNRLI
jgi:hypothetical protein